MKLDESQNNDLNPNNGGFHYDFDMVASVVDGFWEINLIDGVILPEEIVKSTPETNAHFQLPPNLSTDKWRAYIYPEDLDRLLSKLNSYLNDYSNTDFYTIEYRIKKTDGGYRWIHSKGKAFRDSTGKPFKLVGMLRDISDQKEVLFLKNHLEEEVQKKTAELQKAVNFQNTMLNSTSFAIISNEKNQLISTFNQGAEKMFGYSASEVIGKKTSVIFHLQEELEEKGREFSAKYNEDITGARIFSYLPNEKNTIYRDKWTLLRKNGEKFPAIITLSALKDKKGLFMGLLGVIEDISQLQKIEQALKLQKERFNLVINNSSDYVWLMSLEMKPMYIAPSCQRFIGYTEKEIMQMSIAEIHMPKSVRKINLTLKKALRSNEKRFRIEDELEYIHKNGNIIIAEVKAYAVYDQAGKLYAVAGISRDITARKKAEQKQKKQNEKIKQAFQDITDSIHYAKTIQEALLTKKELINNYFEEYFILFEPKEQVSGDFYYVNKIENHLILAVADCTGHGVPGGFLTMLGITYLHEIVKQVETTNVAEVLNLLREKVKDTFKSFGNENQNGLEIALCEIDTQSNILQYAGAYHPLWIIRNNELLEYKATRNPVGFHPKEIPFQRIKIQLQKNDMIYLFSDGFRDQFGGEGNIKYGRKRFRKLVLEIHNLPMSKQQQKLSQVFQEWKNNEEQIDDTTIMGIKWEY